MSMCQAILSPPGNVYVFPTSMVLFLELNFILQMCCAIIYLTHLIAALGLGWWFEPRLFFENETIWKFEMFAEEKWTD